MSPEQQAAEKTIQERLNARCETLEQYLFYCFMDAKYANAASKAASVVFLLKKDIEALIEDTDKQAPSGVSWQKENGWISVEDKPELKPGWSHSAQCLVWYNAEESGRSEGYGIAYYHSDPPYSTRGWIDFSQYGRRPSFWQPLPPAPASIINK